MAITKKIARTSGTLMTSISFRYLHLLLFLFHSLSLSLSKSISVSFSFSLKIYFLVLVKKGNQCSNLDLVVIGFQCCGLCDRQRQCLSFQLDIFFSLSKEQGQHERGNCGVHATLKGVFALGKLSRYYVWN